MKIHHDLYSALLPDVPMHNWMPVEMVLYLSDNDIEFDQSVPADALREHLMQTTLLQ
jgi:hypothetical protein